MTYAMSTPWTISGRYNAIQKGVGKIYERYFAGGPRWVAKHLPERQHMAAYRDRLSPESKEILLGDFGVESFIEDYAVLAIQASGDSLATRHIYTQWVFDENRHSKALWYCLSDSDLYSHRELDDYMYECGQDVWTFERQTGHEATPERGAAYAIAQERQTKRNYQKMQARIWGEYGKPRDSDGKPAYPAIAGVCRTLATDEGYHEAVFRKISRVYLQYWPDKAIQSMWDVYEKYRMPIVKLPNAEAFIDAVLSTGIDSPRDVISNVLQPTYEGLGFESRAALKRAARQSWDLPENAILVVGDEFPDPLPEGAEPYRLNPDGRITPAAPASGPNPSSVVAS
jgi:hypothetical protein